MMPPFSAGFSASGFSRQLFSRHYDYCIFFHFRWLSAILQLLAFVAIEDAAISTSPPLADSSKMAQRRGVICSAATAKKCAAIYAGAMRQQNARKKEASKTQKTSDGAARVCAKPCCYAADAHYPRTSTRFFRRSGTARAGKQA